MPQDVEKQVGDIRRRIEEIKSKITRMDLVCSGTLIKRKKTCGKSNCKCLSDPHARHGPYNEWSRREGGRLVHNIVSPEQARELKKAIVNRREIQALIGRWERESTTIILGTRGRKG